MFDVTIIGTGPAGGMAATCLAASGHRILLLEKHTLPRHKPCGGGLTASVADLIPWDLAPLVERRVTRVRHLLDFERPHDVVATAPLLMIDRSRFDAALVDAALARGRGDVQLRQGVRVRAVREDAPGVVIECEGGETIATSFLIAADGASSPTARALSLAAGPARPCVALDAEVAVTPEVWEQESARATFNFFCLPNGYGWIFPKRETLSCGVGAWRHPSSLPRALDRFLERSFPPGSFVQVRRSAHPVPLYAGPRTLATRRVCLVGDAASLVDPIMGEGIRFALHSGKMAADVVAGLLGAASSPDAVTPGTGGDCRIYQHRIRHALGQPFDALRQIAQPIFLGAPEYFYEKFIVGSGNYHRVSRQIAQQMQSLPSRP